MTPQHMETSLDTQVDRPARIRAEMARHRAACGCELGSVFALAALVAFVAYLCSGQPDWSSSGTVARGLVWVVTVSVVGKLIGLAYARMRLLQLRAELRRLTSFPTTSPLHPVRK